MSQASFLRLPHFISAKTPKELQRKMLIVNANNNMQYEFFSIQFDGKNWFAWYVKELKIDLVPQNGELNVVIDGQTI